MKLYKVILSYIKLYEELYIIILSYIKLYEVI